MSEPAEPETDEEYYQPMMKPFRWVDCKQSIERYGKETEPKEGKGKKSRAIRTKDLAAIQLAMLAEVEKDIMKNARLAWVYGSPLFPKDSIMQPLGDYPKNL